MSYENLPPKLFAMVDKAMNEIKAMNLAWFAVCEKISWTVNPNLRRSLGMACYRIWTIEISGPYLEGGADSDIQNTVTHELAHFISTYCFNCSGHGPMWKRVHMMLGGSAKRCTDAGKGGYKVKRNVVKRVVVGRDGKEYQVTFARWAKQQYFLESRGYAYLRTVQINSDGSEKLLHSHKEVKAAEIYLDAKLNRIA